MSSNPMKSALSRAAADLADQCSEAGIRFDFGRRLIIWRDVEKHIPQGTPRSEVKRTLRKMITAEKEIKRKQRQAVLL